MKIIIEVGANIGTDTKKFADDANNLIFAFEPTPQLFLHLVEKFKTYCNVKLFPYAIDSDEGLAVFNIAGTGDWGCSSLYDFQEDIHSQWQNRPDFVFTEQCTVEKKRLDNIIVQENIQQIDYLWIDAQGNDFRVLKSLGEKLDLVKEGKCEGSSTVNLYQNTTNHVDDIVKFLVERGFTCDIVPDNVGKEADVHFKKL
jgi:FkbM family methyltransferase